MKVIATAWAAYEQQVIPPHGQEATEDDLWRMDAIAAEIKEHVVIEQALARAEIAARKGERT